MAEWSLMERDWKPNPYDPYQYSYNPFYQESQQPPCLPLPQPPPAQTYVSQNSQTLSTLQYQEPSTSRVLMYNPPAQPPPPPKPDNPREIRNKAEKQRRDKLNQSIGELASMVPPVVATSRKIDKTGVLRLTAHYLRSHQYVFGDSINQEDSQQFSAMSTRALLALLNGFLLTTTYRGLIVVVSQNVQQYLGYSELDLLGQSVFNIIHEDDRQLMRDMLMPKSHMLGPNGELLVPDEPEGKRKLADILSSEKKRFLVRFKKLGQRSEPSQYVTCHVEGTLRKSDRACRGYNRCCQMVRRARARGDNPCNSGNDIVFVGMVRSATDTFISESNMESFRMEYRTRHAIDGQILQSEHRISLVTGFMKHEVLGFNAMTFMHRDDVRWVVIALREMYDQHRLVGESCYRLMSKTGDFIYMKTRGQLDVDPVTRAVTSFVCTNTVLDEKEGKHLIRMMKKKFMLMVNNNDELPLEEEKESNNQTIEDPRQLEKVILHLVTNLPSPQPEDESSSSCASSPDRGLPPPGRLAFIPPKKEKILSAIEKMYTMIKTFPTDRDSPQNLPMGKVDQASLPKVVVNAATMSQLESLKNPPRLFPIEINNPLPKLPTFSDVYSRRQAHNSNEIGNNMFESTSPIPTVSSTNYLGMATITLGNSVNSDNIKNGEDNVKPVCVSPTENELFVNGKDKDKSLSALIGRSNTGVKRSREQTELYDVTYVSKKKNGGEDSAKTDEDKNSFDTPLLDSLFDEELFNTSLSQIDTDINSLEQNIDAAFPDLLISQDVQDILQEIEGDQQPTVENVENYH